MPVPQFWVSSDDWHTAGEPFRIIRDLPVHCTSTAALSTKGLSVEQRRRAIVNTPGHPIDVLRQALCQEPRGHADMFGGFVVPADDPGAHFGILFWHKDGFARACGHGTIALACWAITSGLVEAPKDGEVDVLIDAPSGRVTAKVRMEGDRPDKVHFINVPTYQIAAGLTVRAQDKIINADLAWGGAVYALPTTMLSSNLAGELKFALGPEARHRGQDLFGVCLYQHHTDTAEAIEQRSVCVFADGAVDRSPCGTATSGRAAVLLAQGKLAPGKKFTHRSILDTVFTASIESSAKSPTCFPGCVVRVTGRAHLMGKHSFYIDEADPTYPGFLLR